MLNMLNRLFALVSKEIVQFSRDRVLLAFVIGAPAIQLILMGHAIGQDVTNIPVAVIDYDVSELSRDVITALDNTQELVVTRYPADLTEGQELIDQGEIDGLIVIPRGFMADTQSSSDVAQVQVIINGVSSVVGGRVLGAAEGAIQSLSDQVVVTQGGTPGGIRVFSQALFNSTLDFRPDSIASQVALITFEVTTLVAVMGIVREREIGTIEMLTITPLRKLELIAGKAITPFLISVVDFILMVIVSQVVFHIPLRGPVLTLFGLTLIYLVTEIAYALIFSTLTRSQQQATTLIFVWAVFGLTMSGYMVPISTLPEAVQWISWAVPLRHYLQIVRSVMLKGAGFATLWPEGLALLVLAVVALLITTRTLSRVTE
jgi:ABC-2 type transport system permease protein